MVRKLFKLRKMNSKVYKLFKQLFAIVEVVTDKGILVIEEELKEGIKVYRELDGELVSAEEGIYETETHIITVKEGLIESLEEKKEEEIIEETPEETPEVVEEVLEEPETIEEENIIADMAERIAELEKSIEEKDRKIAELEAIIEKQNEELHLSAAKPAKEEVKAEKKGALRFF